MAEPTEPQPTVDPVEVPVAEAPVAEPLVEPADPVEPEVVEEPAVTAEPIVEEPVAPVAVVAPVATEAAAREVVYVQAPTAPRPRSNRGFGVLLSALGTVIFALLYIGVFAIITAVLGQPLEAPLTSFLQSAAFWVPVGVYLVISVLFALIVNRAAWWAHALGSLFVAVLTYAIAGGIIALTQNVIAMTPDEGVAELHAIFSAPWLIAALVLAREVSLWIGLGISSRGRRVRERNLAERAEFEQNAADRRAEYERAHPAV